MSTKYHRLLLIFIHGFKGDDHTFKDFPVRLQNAITESVRDVVAEQIIYPRYETRGDLKQAVEMFCIWLEGIVEEREKELKGIGDVWVCLICHSMGGILAADTILKYTNQTEIRPPKIIGLLAFDTPYYGVDNDVITKTAFERVNKVQQNISGSYNLLSSAATAGGFLATSQKVTTKPVNSSSSGWGKWGLAAGVVAGVAAFAYYHKDKFSQGAEYLGSHYEFVGVLFNPTELRERVQNLVKVKNLAFHCYYAEIIREDEHKTKTFISLPPPDMVSYFSAITSTSDDEIDAHISIFNPDQTNGLDNITLKRLIEIVENYEKIVS